MSTPTADPWRDRIVGSGDVAPGELLANPKNWREHPEFQREALGAVLDRVGWVQRVIVNKRTGLMVDGHLRVELAKERREKSVPVEYIDVSEEEESLILATLDPLAALASTNRDRLRELLGDLNANGDKRMKALLASLRRQAGPGNLGDPEVVPPVPVKPTSKRGDMWLLGDHRVLCGDSTASADAERLLDGAKPGLMVTDPPYGVSVAGAWREDSHRMGLAVHGGGHRTDSMQGDDRSDWSAAWALSPASVAYVWHAGLYAHEVGLQLAASGFEIRAQIIWRKPYPVLSRGHYHWQHEPCWYAVRKGETADWVGDRSTSTVWDIGVVGDPYGRAEQSVSTHAAQKPLECMARPMRNHEGDVYDPFLGTGTTLIACEQLERRCYGMEIEPRYVDVVVKRWEQFTGRRAKRSPKN